MTILGKLGSICAGCGQRIRCGCGAIPFVSERKLLAKLMNRNTVEMCIHKLIPHADMHTQSKLDLLWSPPPPPPPVVGAAAPSQMHAWATAATNIYDAYKFAEAELYHRGFPTTTKKCNRVLKNEDRSRLFDCVSLAHHLREVPPPDINHFDVQTASAYGSVLLLEKPLDPTSAAIAFGIMAAADHDAFIVKDNQILVRYEAGGRMVGAGGTLWS